ncbi:hypothetical protein HDV06_006347 [Boothiomyces sp. JEL0866]|nr:hypothetical protein HDV06_006347 [Boothiomyces sp. JEL0866]
MILIHMRYAKDQKLLNTKKENQINEMTIRKILAYVVVYVLEWSPCVPQFLLGIFNYYADWIYLTTMIGIGLAGTLNFAAFNMNERLKEKIFQRQSIRKVPENGTTAAL